jgi:enamine deaminase RidA (YjgF/YER057c/UK114 family)
VGKIEERLVELGITLPAVPNPLGTYIPANRYGNFVYTSGQGSREVVGQVGGDLTVEQGRKGAEEACLRCLACLQAELGTLDRVKKILKVLGFVNSAPGFGQQPAVMNGCSDMLVKVFGENGRHARSAIGTNALPNGIAVEVEMLVIVE